MDLVCKQGDFLARCADFIVIDEKHASQNNRRNIISILENCLISTYLLCFSTQVNMKKVVQIRESLSYRLLINPS